MVQPARTTLVTGGGRGIGASVCRALAADGIRVAVADLDAAGADASAAALPGGPHLALPMDVTDEASVQASFEAAARAFGRA